MGAIAFTSGASAAAQVGLAGVSSAGSNYTALGFGVNLAGAQGASVSEANFTILGTPVLGVNAGTASTSAAVGQ
jgi:hypothetical protein